MRKPRLVDIHSHFVYGLDDGARTQQDMYDMLDAAYRDGISVLYATPHIVPGVRPFSEAIFQAHLEEARAYGDGKGYGMTLIPGAELLYTPAMHPYIEEQRLMTMGGTDQVLVEFTPEISYQELTETVDALERAGYIPILAHIERYQCLFRGQNLRKLKEHNDVRCQINANTLLTKQGFIRQQILNKWLRAELVDHVASDAHNTGSRPFRMQQAYQALQGKCSEAYSRALTGGNADWDA